MEAYLDTLSEFRDRFATEEACIAYLTAPSDGPMDSSAPNAAGAADGKCIVACVPLPEVPVPDFGNLRDHFPSDSEAVTSKVSVSPPVRNGPTLHVLVDPPGGLPIYLHKARKV